MTLANGEVIAMLRGTGDAIEPVAIVIANGANFEVLWSGRLDPHGDPGERVADFVDVSDRTGDGHPDLVVGEVHEGVELCDGTPIVVSPRAFDPRSRELRPVALRIPVPAAEVVIDASSQAPIERAEPIIRSLFVLGSSDGNGRVASARALQDDDRATAWRPARYGETLLLLRYGGDRPIHAIRIEGQGPLGSNLRVVSPERVFRVRAESGAETAWVVFPEPLETSCLALLAGSGPADAADSPGIAALRVYSDLDFGRGLSTLVSELVQGGVRADRAADWLGQLGEQGLEPLSAAWEQLDARGRARALRVAAALPLDSSRPMLMNGARDEDREVSEAALAILADHRAFNALIELSATDSGDRGERAALALSQLATLEQEVPEDLVLGPLLSALDRDGGADRPALRLAIAELVARSASAGPRIAEWAESAPVAALASLALGLGEKAPRAAVAPIDRAIRGAEAVNDRYRLALAIAELPSELRSDAMLTWANEETLAASEWMIRAETVRSAYPDTARRALTDAYPRVRLAATLALGDDEASRALIHEDSWPMVRRAALTAHPDAAREALADDAEMVRQRAVQLLARAGDRAAWSEIEQRLVDDDEWPVVTHAATSYVETLCVESAGPALAEVVRRGASTDAWQPYLDEAEYALYVALRLGNEASAAARRIALRSENPRLLAVLEQPEPAPCHPANREAVVR